MPDGPVPPGGDTRGARLAAAVREQLKIAPPEGDFDFIQVTGLSGCLSPCNVALRAPRKYNLRFARVASEDAAQASHCCMPT